MVLRHDANVLLRKWAVPGFSQQTGISEHK